MSDAFKAQISRFDTNLASMAYSQIVDLIAGCRCFVEVSDRGSFTAAAVSLGIVQPVVSRRVAALERSLGGALFHRSTRNVVLTPLGATMLGKARQLCELADEFSLQAVDQRARPVRLCVPEHCELSDLSAVVATAHRLGFQIKICRCDVYRGVHSFRALEVDLLVETGPEAEAQWAAQLGVAGQRNAGTGRFFLDSMRTFPLTEPAAALWLQAIDDVPAIRDPLLRAGDRAALIRRQLRVASHLTEWIAPVSYTGSLLLCTEVEAARHGLFWRAIGDLELHRFLRVTAREPVPELTGAAEFSRTMARALGMPATKVPERAR